MRGQKQLDHEAISARSASGADDFGDKKNIAQLEISVFVEFLYINRLLFVCFLFNLFRGLRTLLPL